MLQKKLDIVVSKVNKVTPAIARKYGFSTGDAVELAGCKVTMDRIGELTPHQVVLVNNLYEKMRSARLISEKEHEEAYGKHKVFRA